MTGLPPAADAGRGGGGGGGGKEGALRIDFWDVLQTRARLNLEVLQETTETLLICTKCFLF